MKREEAIHIVKTTKDWSELREALAVLVPELRESEDERIRKEIIEFIQWSEIRGGVRDDWHQRKRPAEWITYLERQKEQKPDIEICPHSIKSKSYKENGYPIEDCDYGLEIAFDILEKTFGEVRGYQTDDGIREHQTAIEAVRKAKEQKPIEFKNDELVEIIKGEFEGFRTLLKKKGIDYEPQRSYWEGFARLFDSSAREYVKEQQEQKPISSCDIVPYIDDKIAALQDMWRKEKVAFDWDDMHEMIEDVARHFYQKEQKPAEWSEKDKNIFKLALDLIKHSDDCDGILDRELAVKWFAELPSRFVPQPKQEWSDDDKQWLESIIREYEERLSVDKDHAAVIQVKIDLLKSLLPHWKPSEEQMNVLLSTIQDKHNAARFYSLSSLYKDLKKLCQ